MAIIVGNPAFVFDLELGDTAGHIDFVYDVQLDEFHLGFVYDVSLSLSPTAYTFTVELLPGILPPLPPEPDQVPEPSVLQTTWVWNKANQAWAFDRAPRVLTLGQQVWELGNVRVINDLQGYIDALQGTIDSLAQDTIHYPSVFKGLNTGEVLRESYEYDTDWDGSAFTLILKSPEFGHPQLRETLQELAIKFESSKAGTIILRGSYDGGVTWACTETSDFSGARLLQMARLMRGLTGREICWQLECSSSDIRVVGWWAQLVSRFRQVE